jgi:hypothetical protein
VTKNTQLIGFQIRGLEDTIEKLNYDMIYKFENTEKSINDAVESVKMDVRQIIADENHIS